MFFVVVGKILAFLGITALYNVFWFTATSYRVRLMDGIVQCLLKSEVVKEEPSIWSNIELVWMESQIIFTTLFSVS